MERTSQEVNHRYRRGGYDRPWFLFWWIILSWTFLLPCDALSQSVDFLVVEKPRHLVVYNAFQQIEKNPKALRPLEPMIIRNPHQLLSDGVTAGMNAEVGGETLYLLLEKRGRLANLNKLGYTKLFSSKRFLSDTVEILSAKRMVMSGVLSNRNIALTAGDRIVRYFTEKKLVYGKLIGTPARYGWIEFPRGREGSWWRVLRIRKDVPPLPPHTIQRITGTMNEINSKLKQLHRIFGEETGTTLPLPQFHIVQTDSLTTITLLPANASVHYRQSLAAFHSRVQVSLLGTGYTAVLKNSSMEIRRR
jgi:hypothetical protein